MVFKDLLEPIAPSVARRPFYQPLALMLAVHIPARHEIIEGRMERDPP